VPLFPKIREVSGEFRRVETEHSDERFDRMAFAERAVDLVARQALREGLIVVLCEGSRLRVETGRRWGGAPGDRWALVSVSKTASKESIAAAVASLAQGAPGAYALDVLLRAQ
jgi:hypothetical protein